MIRWQAPTESGGTPASSLSLGTLSSAGGDNPNSSLCAGPCRYRGHEGMRQTQSVTDSHVCLALGAEPLHVLRVPLSAP